MDLAAAAKTFSLAARDLVVVVAGRESFARHLTEIARRRAARYAAPDSVPEGDGYWTDLAAALAPVLPSELMPMWGLIDAGVTLEGGARGLRSLFSAVPSEKERRRVQRTAGLASRVMALAGGADGALTDDEKRLGDMAMCSFGLSPDELAAARGEAPASAAKLEVYGELDARVRRELVRGAWQVAMQDKLTPREEDEVLTLAAKLEVSADLGAIRREAADALARTARVASLAVELTRAASEGLVSERLPSVMEHLIRAAAPPSAAPELRSRLTAADRPDLAKHAALVSPQRAQAIALAWTSLRALDLTASTEALARGRLRAAAASIDAASEAAGAMELVDRYLNERVAESVRPGTDG